jgi:hypothetical protein
MSSGLRNLLKSIIWFPFAVGVLIWLGVVGWQTVPYSTRLFGYDSANPGGVPLQAMGCPLYAISQVGVQVDIPEPTGQQIIYKTYFSIIPADVSLGFESVCSPLTTNTPPIPARAVCFFDIPKLKSADSGAWFLNVSAAQDISGDVSGVAGVDNRYSSVCLIRTQAVFTQDLIAASLIILSGLTLVVVGTFLWPRGIPAKVVMIIAVPVIWYVGALAAGLILAGNSEWSYFALGAMIIAAIIAARVWLSSRTRASHDT